ncbi:MAG: RNA degradosome polyphosphate kinase, partial [Rhodobacteraceae bacterium]|nr:RNA degradosome polyphosphate kinase [Paracoccaceae bacterium]
MASVTADFLQSAPPAPVDMPEGCTRGPERFFNRELSWLGFNWRVLEEAENPTTPLMERLRFLSISANNLDEFYTVRVAGLRELARAGNTTPAADGLTPAQQLTRIHEDARALMTAQQRVLTDLRCEMAQAGLSLVPRAEITAEDQAHLDQVFLDQVFPVLSPLAIDPAHPFPFIANSGFCLALEMERVTTGRQLHALLPIPHQIDRFVRLPAKGQAQRHIAMEELLLLFIDRLFPSHRLKAHFAFRILRDSDLEVEEEAEDLVREFEVALKRRRRGEVVRMTHSANPPAALLQTIMEELRVGDEELVQMDGMLGLADLSELVDQAPADLLWQPFTPRMPERIQDHEGDIFSAIRHKDMLLHHPYET